MLRRFLLTLLSSWIVNPLGVLAAQWFGVANSSVVILVLLVSGACVPFQLLLNECVAASVARGSVRATWTQLILIVVVQAVASAWAVWSLAAQQFPAVHIAVAVALLAMNSLLSYRVSMRFYALTTGGDISMRAAVVIGTIPGVTTLLLYLAYCFVSRWSLSVAASFILVSVVIPTLAQWAYLQNISSRETVPMVTNNGPKPILATIWIVASVGALAALAAASTRLREIISHLSAAHVALMLVGLNSLLSLINTSTRATFLSRSEGGLRGILASATLLALSLYVAGEVLRWPFSPVFALLATQAAIAWVVEAARRMPISATDAPPISG